MLNDIRYALRTLRQNPAFALTAIISIALAIGADSAIFSFQDGLLLRPLGIEKPDEVVTVTSRPPSGAVEAFAYPDFVELRDKNRTFEGLAAYRLIQTGVAKDEDKNQKAQPKIQTGFLVSGNFFDLLGVKPALGRTFRPDEDQVPGRDAVIVLSHEFWKNEFGGDLSIVGRHLWIGPRAVDFSVIGVTPESFTGMDLFIHPEFFVPAMMGPVVVGISDLLTTRKATAVENAFNVKGRLKSGVSIQAANADIGAIAKALEASFPDSNRGRKAAVRTEIQARLDYSPILGGIVAAVSGVMVVILLIACANLMNLMLSRGRGRAREISVRLAIGANRVRLIRQLMAESLVIALLGGALGLFVAQSAIAFFATLELPSEVPLKFDFELDNRVLFFTFLVSIASAVLFGLLPALRSTRTDLNTALKAGEWVDPRKGFFGRNTLVTIQIAGSVVMLLAAVQMYRNTSKVLIDYPGFAKDHRLTLRLDTALANYTPGQTEQFYRMLIDRVQALPGIRSVALASGLPLTTEALAWLVVPEGYQFPTGQESIRLRADLVDENYFSTFGVPIVAGRGFQLSDQENSPRVAMVNEEFARRIFGGNAIGKRIRLQDDNKGWAEIVGITTTGKYNVITEPPQMHVYMAFRQNPISRMTLIAETAGAPASATGLLRDVIGSIDPIMPIFSVRTMEEVFQRGAVSQVRIFNVVFSVTGLMGFVLAIVGLYAVVSYQVSRRTREIGVRIAVGAQRSQVVRMILKQAEIVAGIGVGIGVLFSIAARPALMMSMGQRASSFDLLTISIIPLSLLLITLLAAAIPARRAAQVDPQIALRQD